MIRLFVVCSVHEDRGRANSQALLGILGQIQPQVIFVEVPPELNEEQKMDGLPERLESRAVEVYCTQHRAEVIPVDLPTPNKEFFRRHEALHLRIEKISPEYRRLIDWHRQYVSGYGYPYLNSVYVDRNRSELDSEIQNAVEELKDPKLTEIHEGI